jgi:hypothetical protein
MTSSVGVNVSNAAQRDPVFSASVRFLDIVQDLNLIFAGFEVVNDDIDDAGKTLRRSTW